MYEIRTSDIIVARSDAATAEPLPDGLAKSVYDTPVVLRDDNVLIDGLRRLRRAQAQGKESIRALRVQDFHEAIDALTKQHEGRTVTPRRIWDIMSVLYDYARQLWQSPGGWVRGPDGKLVRPVGRQTRRDSQGSRKYYLEALNTTVHTIQATVYMYRRAEQGDERAKALVARVDTGEFSIHQAHVRYSRPNNLAGHVTSQKEQAQILERGVASLAAEMGILQKLGHPLVVSDEDLAKAIDGLVEVRTAMYQMIRGFRQIQKERHG